MKDKKARIGSFPDVLYVHQDWDGGNVWFVAEQNLSSKDQDGDYIAIYQLREIKRLKIEKNLI